MAAVIGSEAALRLCEHFGGTSLYVPHRMHDGHPIVAALGLDAATLLSSHFTGDFITLPNISRRREIHNRRREVLRLAAENPNRTAKSIALATGYTERHVHNIIGESGGDPRQLKLFDDN
ncbi:MULTISPECIES: hypothetical protein [unclassified Sphingopyxis]|uniref:hypothetical protein n=1 Tax=unclassified Sphingopyxis TaxID=2614943 RepID=UPI0012E3C04F|nr:MULTISPECIES: hypothetical protein [unclassified Sphingopyxis]